MKHADGSIETLDTSRTPRYKDDWSDGRFLRPFRKFKGLSVGRKESYKVTNELLKYFF